MDSDTPPPTASETHPILLNERLPSELLIEIFSALVASTEAGAQENDPSAIANAKPIHGPAWEAFLLASVCTRWRAIVLKTPQFWNRISLNYGPTERYDSNAIGANYIERLQRILERAALQELDITISCAGMPNRLFDHDGSIAPLTTHLLRIAAAAGLDRWRSLTLVYTRDSQLGFRVRPDDVADIFSANAQYGSFSRLEKLAIFGGPWGTDNDPYAGILNLVDSTAHNLNRLEAYDASVKATGALSRYEFLTRITSLRAPEFVLWASMKEADTISLNELELASLYATGRSIHLPQLQTLRVRGLCSLTSIAQIQMPHISTLIIHNLGRGDIPTNHGFLTLPTLKRLQITGGLFEMAMNIECPFLEELQLERTGVGASKGFFPFEGVFGVFGIRRGGKLQEADGPTFKKTLSTMTLALRFPSSKIFYYFSVMPALTTLRLLVSKPVQKDYFVTPLLERHTPKDKKEANGGAFAILPALTDLTLDFGWIRMRDEVSEEYISEVWNARREAAGGTLKRIRGHWLDNSWRVWS